MEIFLLCSIVVVIAVALWMILGRSARPSLPAAKAARAARPAQAQKRAAPQPQQQPQPAPPPDPMPRAIADAIAREADAVAEDLGAPLMLEGFTLHNPDSLPAHRLEELTAALAALPLPPRSMRELLSPEFMANAEPRKFTELVLSEPLLAAKIISRVNSAFYGLSSPIGSVPHAVTYLGMNAARNLALQFALEQSFAEHDPELREYQARLFDTGTIAAELASVLGPKLGIRDVGALSTHAVLSFLGDFAMPALMPPGTAIANWPLGLLERSCNEQMSIGVASPAIGEILMTQWELPAAFIAELRGIHEILVTPASARLSEKEIRHALCFACARIAEQIALGRPGVAPDLLEGDVEHYPECYHLGGYLQQAPLSALAAMVRGSDVQLVVQRLAAGVRRRHEGDHQSARML